MENTNNNPNTAPIIPMVLITVGVFFGLKYLWDKKEEKDAAANQNNQQLSDSQIPNYTPVPSPPVITNSPAITPSLPKNAKLPKIGDPMYAGPKGANAYNSASYSTANGNIYKYYPAGQYIGTFLAKDGIYTKVAVREVGSWYTSVKDKQVWVMTSNLIFKA